MRNSKLHLDKVTLIALATSDLEGNKRAFDICLHYCDFADAKLLTSKDIGKDLSYEEYTAWMVKESIHFFETDYMLFIHPDGHILNPAAWTNEFYEYDCIGAPWKCFPPGWDVGNSGFTLRSRKLHYVLAHDDMIEPIYDNEVKGFTPDDVVVCRKYRKYLENYYGIKYAPADVASKFSTECSAWVDSFGYHGRPSVTDISKWNCPI